VTRKRLARAFGNAKRLFLAADTSVLVVAAVVFAAHLGLAWLQVLPRAPRQFEVLAGVAFFVFGLAVSFSIENARNKAARVNELLKASDADLVSISKLSTAFDDGTQEELLALIDQHVQDQIDYRIVDFPLTSPSFMRLFDRVTQINPQGDRQNGCYNHLLAVCIGAAERRKQLEAAVRRHISGAEWVTLLALFAALWALVLPSAHGSAAAQVIAGILVACLAGMLRLLFRLDHYAWQEAHSTWQPLHILFESLDLLPYYPKAIIDSGRARPDPGKVRLAEYPRSYPDMRGKVVAVYQINPEGSSTGIVLVEDSAITSSHTLEANGY
jgi:hypothetical protein